MTYEYVCKACSHEWEAEQSIKDSPLKTCPKCGADQAQRQISRSGGFILKGGGWYSDLYSSSKPGAKTESSADSTTSKTEPSSAASSTPAPKATSVD